MTPISHHLHSTTTRSLLRCRNPPALSPFTHPLFRYSALAAGPGLVCLIVPMAVQRLRTPEQLFSFFFPFFPLRGSPLTGSAWGGVGKFIHSEDASRVFVLLALSSHKRSPRSRVAHSEGSPPAADKIPRIAALCWTRWPVQQPGSTPNRRLAVDTRPYLSGCDNLGSNLGRSDTQGHAACSRSMTVRRRLSLHGQEQAES